MDFCSVISANFDVPGCHVIIPYDVVVHRMCLLRTKLLATAQGLKGTSER